MCIDMRQANKAIVRERYPIPSVQEMLVEVNGAKVFSKLDLRQGFFQCELEPVSRDVTTFVTHMGLFRTKRLSMGVTSAPECFQCTIQKVLNGLAGVLIWMTILLFLVVMHRSTRSTKSGCSRSCIDCWSVV